MYLYRILLALGKSGGSVGSMGAGIGFWQPCRNKLCTKKGRLNQNMILFRLSCIEFVDKLSCW